MEQRQLNTEYKTIYEPLSKVFDSSLELKLIRETQEFIRFVLAEHNDFDWYELRTLKNMSNYNRPDYLYNYTKDFALKAVRYLINKENIYFTPNCFKVRRGGKARAKDNMTKVNCFVLDIDFKDQELSQEEIKDIVLNKLRIRPSYILNTGNGLHIYYKINPYNLLYKYSITYHDRIYSSLVKTYEKYGIITDTNITSDLERLFRLPNTINYDIDKDLEKKKCKIIYKDLEAIYNLKDIKLMTEGIYEELAEAEKSKYNAKAEKWLKEKEKRKNKVFEYNFNDSNTKKFTPLSLHSRRSEDLKFLIRQGKAKRGMRDNFLFYYCANMLHLDHIKTSQDRIDAYRYQYDRYLFELEEVNQMFDEPVETDELDNIILYLLRNRNSYNKMKTSTFIEKLDITTEEQEKLKVLKDKQISKKCRNKKYYEANKEENNQKKNIKRREARKEVNKLEKEKKKYEKLMRSYEESSKVIREKNRKKAIQRLSSTGKFTQSEIAKISSISIRTIRNILKS